MVSPENNTKKQGGLTMSIAQAITKIQWPFDPRTSTDQRNFSVPGTSPSVHDAATVDVFGPAEDTLFIGGFVDAQAVRVGSIWLFQETFERLNQLPGEQSPLEKARTAVMRGVSHMTELPKGILTQHALMAPLGEFAHEIGLIQQLQSVPIPQKGVVHAPQAKILTFLMGILTGITHLKDLNEGPHPLAHDWAATRAWSLDSLAHYTGVSRTLASCDDDTVEAIKKVLDQISQPFIDQEIHHLRQQNSPLIIDFDIAPRRVSNQSTTFPEAEFGWQGDKVGLGYDAALVALTSPTYGRIFLTGFHHPRNPVGLERLQKMVHVAEERLGLRPRRRPELVQTRLRYLEQTIAQRQGWLESQQDKQKAFRTQLERLPEQVIRLKAHVTELEVTYSTRKASKVSHRARGRTEKPHSQLAKARRQLATWQKKLRKANQAYKQAQRAEATHQKRLEQLQAEHASLTKHLARLQTDNEKNPDPVPIILRMDAGFGTGPNITWLIEMGYFIYTKAKNAKVVTKLKAQVQSNTQWTRVGKNAEMITWDKQCISNCPYPLTVALERFHTPDGLKHSALLSYRDDGQVLTLRDWFDFYNGRQIIEAGIKESNVVFKMHPLKMRSRGGILIQEQFALFAANFVRWAAVWLSNRVSRRSRRFSDALTRIKALVRVAANTSAWVVWEDESLLVKFDETGAYPGVELRLAGTSLFRPPIRPRKKVQEVNFEDESALDCT